MVSQKTVWPFWLYQLLWLGLDALYPPECGGCGQEGTRWCSDCQQRIIPLVEPFCEICGSPQDVNGICNKCQATRPQYRALRSWAVFEEPIRSVLHRIKYNSDLGLGEPMALELSKVLKKYQWSIDMIVPMPLSKKREFDRGYNQVSVFAFPMAKLTGIKYSRRALLKVRETVSQVGLNAEQRRENVRGAFEANARRVAGKTVLLMDDVATTGSSISAAAEALINAGAKEVFALTIARALSHHDLQIV